MKNMIWFFLVLLCFTQKTFAEECQRFEREVPLRSTLASADTWANMRGSEGSLKAESQKLLNEAEDKISASHAPENLCPVKCRVSKKPEIIFRSIPQKFLSEYSDKEKCKTLLQKTEQSPFVYPGKKFDSIDELNSWIGNFSQGSGPEGRDLYERCDGSCSPQYEYQIVKHGSGMDVNAVVKCGHARDKDDNQFQLSVSYLWQCV